MGSGALTSLATAAIGAGIVLLGRRVTKSRSPWFRYPGMTESDNLVGQHGAGWLMVVFGCLIVLSGLVGLVLGQ